MQVIFSIIWCVICALIGYFLHGWIGTVAGIFIGLAMILAIATDSFEIIGSILDDFDN